MLKTATLLSTLIVLSITTPSHADELDANWLYLSNGGSWIEKSITLQTQLNQLPLPINSLSPDKFWWHSAQKDTQLVWQQPKTNEPRTGQQVRIDSETAPWTITDNRNGTLVLQRNNEQKYWPASQWHRLTWLSASKQEGLQLSVIQAKNEPSEFQYAWFENQLSATVRYRLLMDAPNPTVYQELIISNRSNNTLNASGYSYAQSANRPVAMMRNDVMLEAASVAMDTPVESESQGIPTLIASQEVSVKAGAHSWLPVSQTELSAVKRHYSLQWDTRQNTGSRQASTALHLLAKNELPDIQGPITLGVFDQQLATLNSFYRPHSLKKAILELGQSQLVTLNTKKRNDREWVLTLVNRSDETAPVSLTLNHWQGNQYKSLILDLDVEANQEHSFDVVLNKNGDLSVQ